MKMHRHKRKKRHHDACVCGEHVIDCGYCGTAIIIGCVIFLLTIIGTVLTFTSVLRLCTSDSQCEVGPGEIARCRGICLIDVRSDYCQIDEDCSLTECHTAKCGADGSCLYIPEHGTPCNDGSSCTVSDVCYHGVCRGTELTQPCSMCVDGIFVPDMAKDGTLCSDGSKCTLHVCHAGECKGEDIVCPNATCKVGVCDPETGCSLVNAPDSAFQPDLCTTAMCENGEYIETFKECFDGNPCTLDACFPLSGECVHPLSDESCLTVCSNHSDCVAIGSNTEYMCWDGMCVDAGSSEHIIRISKAEQDLESCDEDHGRLQLRFYMDTTVENGIMYIPLTESIVPIYPHMDVFDVETVYLYEKNAVRSYLSLRSPCKDLTVDCYPFVDGNYEFSVKRYPCTTILGTHCMMDNPTVTTVVAPVSVANCPFGDTVFLSLVPQLNLTQVHYTYMVQMELDDINTWITDVQICIPKFASMRRCILNEKDDGCPYRGCFDTPDTYLDYRLTFLSDSNYTSAVATASNLFNLQFSRGYENYAGDRCENVTSVDFIRFSLMSLAPQFEGRDIVIDVKYDVPTCGSQRRLSEKMRRLATGKL